MSAFAKTSFNAKAYAASRPTYPRQLFDFIFQYHEFGNTNLEWGRRMSEARGKARWDLAIDLGCGTGQSIVELHPFKRKIGVDPSAKMLETARKYAASELKLDERTLKKTFEFVQSPAESLGFINDGSVDLVVSSRTYQNELLTFHSAQAAHWFDWNKLWPELARILRKDGTVAIWGYSEMRFTKYSSLTSLINLYTHGPDPRTSLGPHWEQPGRSLVENHLQDVPNVSSVVPNAFSSEERLYFTGSHYPSLPNALPVILQKKMTWENFETYLRSFSSLYTFQALYPEDAKHPDGDIVKRFLTTLKAKIREEDLEADPDKDPGTYRVRDEVDVEWPMALILAKRA